MYRIIVIFIVIALLAGCGAVPDASNAAVKAAPKQQNKWLRQAEADTTMAIRRGAEWRVRDRVTAGKAVNLRTLLEIAQQMQQDGEIVEATRLAIKISRIVAIALQQADDNMNALPDYPQWY